jgi:hypothetical protein
VWNSGICFFAKVKLSISESGQFFYFKNTIFNLARCLKVMYLCSFYCSCSIFVASVVEYLVWFVLGGETFSNPYAPTSVGTMRMDSMEDDG